ncbi:MAG: PmeII family type II restriction endonuclease [bacterium]
MSFLDWDDLTAFTEEKIADYHQKKLESLCALKLKTILRRKNPYLFKAKNLLTASDLVRTLLDAHLSSHEETIFGDFLEELAIYVNAHVFGGKKSSTEGIDLEFDNDGIRYIVAIKSGPNWGNNSQINRMKDNFIKAQRILRTGNSKIHIRAINGCCYGRDSQPDKGAYQKLCGQGFWEFISGDCLLYTRLIGPIGHRAKEKNDDFHMQYAKVLNLFALEFMQHFCDDGEINWTRLVEFNSAA